MTSVTPLSSNRFTPSTVKPSTEITWIWKGLSNVPSSSR